MSPTDEGGAAESSRPDTLWIRLARRAGVDFRQGEVALGLTLFTIFFLITSFQITTKTLRQSAFIDSLGAARLPIAYLAVALISYPFLRFYSRWADTLSIRRLIQLSNCIVAVSLLVFMQLFRLDLGWVPTAFFVGSSIIYAVLISQFWTLANQSLDPRQARRLFGFVGAGGLLGGIAGGQAARLTSRIAATDGPLLAASLCLLAVAVILQFVGEGQARAAGPPVSAGIGKFRKAQGGLETLKRSPLLRSIATLMVLSVVVTQMVDLQFNWAVEQRTEGLADTTAFFGNFFSIMGVSAFIFQLVFTGRIHRRLGIGFATRVLPTSILLGSIVLLITAGMFPALIIAAAIALKLGETGLRYSIDQSTRELLFLPVPTRLRIQAKAYIDVFLQRGGKGFAALLLLPVTFGWLSPAQTGWMTLVFAVVWLGATLVVHREYVTSFREGLSHRDVEQAVPIDLADPVTLELLMQSFASGDRDQILHGLEVFSDGGRPDLIPSLLLYHDDPLVRQKALSVLSLAGRPDVVPLIEHRLGDEDPDVRAEAIRVLADLHGQDVCELMLPRLEERDAAVRAAAVACLTNHGDEEMRAHAAPVLSRLIEEGDEEARGEAARAIGAIAKPFYREDLIGLLYDPEPQVVLAAVAAVRQRVARDGQSPHYLPTLVSLLQNRRVKHSARSALIAFGDEVVPVLAHFLSDADEPVWVRRAIPRVLELLGSASAKHALLAALPTTGDLFTRRKIIESLRDGWSHLEIDETTINQIDAAVGEESKLYLETLARLYSLKALQHADTSCACIRWLESSAPDLLERLLGERADEHVNNLFSLLAVLHDPRDIDAARRGLTGNDSAARAHAVEFLDNLLTGDCRAATLAVIDDHPVREKLREAWRRFSIPVASRRSTLNELLAGGDPHDADGSGLVLAALYAVHTDGESALYPRVHRLAQSGDDPQIQETAEWVVARAAAL